MGSFTESYLFHISSSSLLTSAFPTIIIFSSDTYLLVICPNLGMYQQKRSYFCQFGFFWAHPFQFCICCLLFLSFYKAVKAFFRFPFVFLGIKKSTSGNSTWEKKVIIRPEHAVVYIILFTHPSGTLPKSQSTSLASPHLHVSEWAPARGGSVRRCRTPVHPKEFGLLWYKFCLSLVPPPNRNVYRKPLFSSFAHSADHR